MNSKEFTEFPINLKITNEDMDGIVEKALDEGSLHWIYDFKPIYNQSKPAKNVISNGGRILLYSMDGSVYELSKDKVMLGLQQVIPYLTHSINGDHLDTSYIDSDTADLIIQLALFNELVFD